MGMSLLGRYKETSVFRTVLKSRETLRFAEFPHMAPHEHIKDDTFAIINEHICTHFIKVHTSFPYSFA